MRITAHEVAVAVVAAAQETGAEPEDVIVGLPGGSSVRANYAVSRARGYAARALDRVFNRPNITVARPVIARMIGVAKPSWGSFFASLDGRPLSWWDEEAFKRVINAVMDADPPAEPQAAAPEPPPLKMGPLPPPKHQTAPEPKPRELGTLEAGGYRPSPGTYKREIESRPPRAPGRPRTGLDRFADRYGVPRDDWAGGADQLESRARERRQCQDLLAEAAANTAKLQAKLPPEPDGE